jgi:Zn-dependent protease/predicted transcriptional regulator
MKWSWKLGQVAGIGIFVHWTFLLLIAWIVYFYLFRGANLAGVVDGVLLLAAVFGCIVLHELGHALTARRYGIQTRDITLLPIGGVARLERMPEDPTQELWVALAGPAVNGVIAIVLFAVALSMGLAASLSPTGLAGAFRIGGSFLARLMLINVGLVLFNLVPAFPMDGGRVLRALLAQKLDYVRATQIAASVGQVLAILFGILGFFLTPFALFIALFVYLGAEQEAHMVRVRSVLRGVPIRAAMVTRFRTFTQDESVSTAINELLVGQQHDFPVMDQDRIVGMLTRNDLLAALMRRDCRTVDEAEMLDNIFPRMREWECPTLPVLREGRLVGLVTLENVGEWMMIQSALRKARARGDVDNVFRV